MNRRHITDEERSALRRMRDFVDSGDTRIRDSAYPGGVSQYEQDSEILVNLALSEFPPDPPAVVTRIEKCESMGRWSLEVLIEGKWVHFATDWLAVVERMQRQIEALAREQREEK